MAGISNSNFYIDNTSIDTLREKYKTSIKNLTDSYFDFEAEINNIESQELWKGESFNKFKEEFDDWKMKYLKELSELVQIKQFLDDVVATSEMLIEERESLTASLEG